MEVTRGRARDVAVVAGARAGQLKPIQGPASTATTGGHVPNDFTGRAPSSPPPFTLYRERSSGKALVLLCHKIGTAPTFVEQDSISG